MWEEVVGSTDYSEKRVEKKKPKSAQGQDGSQSSDRRANGRENDADDSDGFSLNLNLPFAEYIVYAVVGAVIIFILFLVIKNISFRSGRKPVTKEVTPAAPVIENIQALETDRLLEEAIASGNYRLAVRLCFLGMLKSLDEQGVIVWKKDKTNRDYLSELYTRKHHYEDIRRLTLDYEQVWYGEHDLSRSSYEEVINAFRSMLEKLKEAKVV